MSTITLFSLSNEVDFAAQRRAKSRDMHVFGERTVNEVHSQSFAQVTSLSLFALLSEVRDARIRRV